MIKMLFWNIEFLCFFTAAKYNCFIQRIFTETLLHSGYFFVSSSQQILL